jgi:Skp family chaperone for outer membrane proteins
MKEAMHTYETNEKIRQGEIDTLVADLQHTVTIARQFQAQKDDKEVARLSSMIELKQEQLIKHKRTLEERSQEEEQKALEGVLSQINAFVEQYAKEKGYDIVFGTTADGSLLYGRHGMDITDEVLVELNKQHEGL